MLPLILLSVNQIYPLQLISYNILNFKPMLISLFTLKMLRFTRYSYSIFHCRYALITHRRTRLASSTQSTWAICGNKYTDQLTSPHQLTTTQSTLKSKHRVQKPNLNSTPSSMTVPTTIHLTLDLLCIFYKLKYAVLSIRNMVLIPALCFKN